MDISINNVEFNEDSWKNLPKQLGWKQLYAKIKVVLTSKLTEDQTKGVLNEIDNIIEILVRKGDTYESLVLEIAIVYTLLTNTQLNLNDLNLNINQYVEEGVNTLVLASNQGDLKSIFENKKMPYLNKIKLAEYICSLENSKSISNRFRVLAEAKKVVELFGGITHKGLMKMLIELCKN